MGLVSENNHFFLNGAEIDRTSKENRIRHTPMGGVNPKENDGLWKPGGESRGRNSQPSLN